MPSSSSAAVRWGVTLPLPAVHLRDHCDLLRQVAAAGYSDVWSAEGTGVDGVTPLVLTAAWEPSLRVGTGVLPVYTRGPAVLAQTAATLAELAPGRVLFGIGASVPAHVRAYNGIAFGRPYGRVRDTVRFLRRALRGEEVTEQYETFAVQGFQLRVPPAVPPRVILGALRPRMLRLAFDEADGAMTNLLAAADLPRVLSTVGDRPGSGELIVKVFVCPTQDSGLARATGRRFLARMLNHPGYRAFHEWLGRADVLAATHRHWAEGDRAAAERALPDEVVDELWIHGSAEQCRRRIARYLQPGVDTVVLYLAETPGLRERPGELIELLHDLRVHDPRPHDLRVEGTGPVPR